MSDPAPTFDLQAHSIYSDGELPPAAVVAAAARAGVELFALTDHDSVDGVDEAIEAGSREGIAVVSGVEVSTIDEVHSDLHILGYGVDSNDVSLRATLERCRAERQLRAQRISEALVELGFALDERVLQARVAEGKAVGRPHLAAAVVTHPDNAPRLEREGLTEASGFLEAYLIEGKPAFRAREAPSVTEAVDLIHEAGGVAIWAHPFWDVADGAEVLRALDRFARAGLDGVEAFYITHDREQTRLLVEHALSRGLLTTGSSDFHGPGHRAFNRFRAFQTFGLEPTLGTIG